MPTEARTGAVDEVTTELALERARRAVELAEAAGADHAVARSGSVRSLELARRDGEVESIEESRSASVGLELFVDGRYSSHVTSDLRPAALREFVENAVAMTRLLEQDPHRRPTPRELWEGRAEVDLDRVDPAVEALTPERRLELVAAIEGAARAGDGVLSATAHLADGHTLFARVASDGFEGTGEHTSIAYAARVSVRDEGERRPEAFRVASATHREDVPAPEEIGRVARERAVRRRGARKTASRRATMVLTPEAAAPFLRRVLGALSAGAVQQRRSFLEGRLGERVASEVLELWDEPHRPRSTASRLFDGDGMATRRRRLFGGGVLETYFVDTYYGSKLGWEPTTTGPTNVVLAGGTGDLDGLVGSVADGFLVEGWLGGNSNATTGDFSFGVYGRRIEGGRLGAPFAEMNVSGGYRDLLPRLAAVGADPEPWSTLRTPTLVFEGVDFSGA